MWKFEREVKQREKTGFGKDERVNKTRAEYVARILVGQKDAYFLLRFYGRRYGEKEESFFEKQIARFSEKRKITKAESAKILGRYIKRLDEKIEKKITTLEALTWSDNARTNEAEKSSEIRHDLLESPIMAFRIELGTLNSFLKKYQ